MKQLKYCWISLPTATVAILLTSLCDLTPLASARQAPASPGKAILQKGRHTRRMVQLGGSRGRVRSGGEAAHKRAMTSGMRSMRESASFAQRWKTIPWLKWESSLGGSLKCPKYSPILICYYLRQLRKPMWTAN